MVIRKKALHIWKYKKLSMKYIKYNTNKKKIKILCNFFRNLILEWEKIWTIFKNKCEKQYNKIIQKYKNSR